MDRLNQRDRLFPLLHVLKDGGFCLFLTSRPHPLDVQHSFRGGAGIELAPNPQEVSDYLTDRLSANPTIGDLLKRWPPDITSSRLLRVLTESGKKMWVK